MTWGQIRRHLKKRFPAVDLEVITVFMQLVYEELLDDIPHQGNQERASLTLPAVVRTGTVALTKGSNAVTGTATAWTTALTGRWFRPVNRAESYVITISTVTPATVATLDRPYEGDTGTGISYELWQDTFTLTEAVKVVRSMRNPQLGCDLARKSETDLASIINSSFVRFSDSLLWAPVGMTAEGSPPQFARVRVFPTPESGGSVEYGYEQRAYSIDINDMAASPVAFISDSSIIDGVAARCREEGRDYVGSQTASGRFEVAKTRTRTNDGRRRGPQVLRLANTSPQRGPVTRRLP